MRTAYAAGDIALPPGWTPGGITGSVPIPGFHDQATMSFIEVQQENSDVGNNAWTLIALLALFRETSDSRYLTTARRIAHFIVGFRNDTGTYRGFQGGIDDPETSTPTLRPWASAEHNLDLSAAFSLMAKITGDSFWADHARHAAAFVESTWDSTIGCYRAGSANPTTLNVTPGQLPLDVQTWSVLAIPDTLRRHPDVLTCARSNHFVVDTATGYDGFDFNEDADGVWFEGTAQMALALRKARDTVAEEHILGVLRRVQDNPRFGAGGGTVATTSRALSSGFGFYYYPRLHIGATAWSVFAQLGYNPFDQTTLR